MQMNDIINWIAVNNTLMIRIGFIAILVLLVVYMFRYFFMPSINVIPEAEEKEVVKENTDSELRAKVEEKQAQHYKEEIEKLLLEVSKLKEQLIESESLVSDLTIKVSQGVSNAAAPKTAADTETAEVSAGAATSATVNSETSSVTQGADSTAGSALDPDYVVSLRNKVETLEARLAEYEIIAEDISEISQLRKDNAELKRRLGGSVTGPASAAASEVVIEEVNEVKAVVLSDEPILVDEFKPDEPEAEAPASEPISEELLVVDESVPEETAPEAEAHVSEALIDELQAELDKANEANANKVNEAAEEVETEIAVSEELLVVDESVPEETEDPTPEALMEELMAATDKVGEEVSQSARELIDEFEEISKKKGS